MRRTENNLPAKAGNEDEPREGGTNATKLRAVESRDGFGHGNPEERDEGCGIMEINLPFRGAPRQQMLKQNRDSNHEPTGAK